MDNQEIAGLLDHFGTLHELDGANTFKVRAFRRASRSIGSLTRDLHSVAEDEGLGSIDGVGKSIAKIVYEKFFQWIIMKINDVIAPDDSSKAWIGVLDIFGFEYFKENSLEQYASPDHSSQY